MPDFLLAKSDFDRQCEILRSLVLAVEVVGDRQAELRAVVADLPTLQAETKNTMASSAIVLLGAHFEEYIRRQVQEYSGEAIREFQHFDDAFKTKWVEAYWKAGLTRLGRVKARDNPSFGSKASKLLLGLDRFPAKLEIDEFVSEWFCDHENNMRWDTIAELAGRIGVKSLMSKLQRYKRIKDAVDAQTADVFELSVKARLRSFQELRNEIVHSVSQAQGVGLTIFLEYLSFLSAFAEAFASSLGNAFSEFERGVTKLKTASQLNDVAEPATAATPLAQQAE